MEKVTMELSSQFEKVIDYAVKKAQLPLWKAFLLAIMGGFFVGLGYLGYHLLLVDSYDGATLVDGKVIPESNLITNKWIASLIFPVGLMMVIFLGGSLFTSNSLMTIGVLEKQLKVKKVAIDWSLVWVGNLVGAVLIAGLNVLAGMYDREPMKLMVEHLAVGKSNPDSWYKYLFSAIGCNILVCGTVYMVFYAKSATGKILITFFGIFLFAISGYQHIVANFYAFLTAGFTQTSSDVIQADAGEVIYSSIIPVTAGNLIGGAIIIPIVYWLINKKFIQVKFMRNRKKWN